MRLQMREVCLCALWIFINTQSALAISVNSASKKPVQYEVVKGGRVVPIHLQGADPVKPGLPAGVGQPVEPIVPEDEDTLDEPAHLAPGREDEPEEIPVPFVMDEELEEIPEDPKVATASLAQPPGGPASPGDGRPRALPADGLSLGSAHSPYSPSAGWKYYLEAGWSQPWPKCEKRFLGHTQMCGKVGLSHVFEKQAFALEAADQAFYIRTDCNTYLSYSTDCHDFEVGSWRGEAGGGQEFEFVRAEQPMAWAIRAKGRGDCRAIFLNFPEDCEVDGEGLGLQFQASSGLGFRLHPTEQNHPESMVREPVTQHTCADPFAWYSKGDDKYHLLCTGANFGMLQSEEIGRSARFKTDGVALARDVDVPAWAAGGERWAAEVADLGKGTDHTSLLFFSVDQQEEGFVHRIGWASSRSGRAAPESFVYGKAPLDLGGEAGGDIDQSIFKDDDGKAYLVWKSDDEWVGLRSTRIWAQQVDWVDGGVVLVGSKKELLDSKGLWWVNGVTKDSSIVEAPKVIKRKGYYYMFFSAGYFCTSSYSEGVARAEGFWGPYEKLQVPFISAGLTGRRGDKKILGPGHAAFVQEDGTGDYFVFYHAHFKEDDHCAGSSQYSSLSVTASRRMRESGRYTFSDRVGWTHDGWPYIESL